MPVVCTRDRGVNFAFFCLGAWQLRVEPFDDPAVWTSAHGDPFAAVAERWGAAPGPGVTAEPTGRAWYQWLGAACRAAPGDAVILGPASRHEAWVECAMALTGRFDDAWPVLEGDITDAFVAVTPVAELLAGSERLTGLTHGDAEIRYHQAARPPCAAPPVSPCW